MSIKKIEIRDKASNYADVLYPKTSTDMVEGLQSKLDAKSDTNHTHAIEGTVEEIVNRRLNTNTGSALNAVISSAVDSSKTTVVNAINALPQKSIWTDARGAKLDNLNQSLSTTQTNITNAVNTARDNIKSHITSSSGSTKKTIYNLHNSNILSTLSTNITVLAEYKLVGKFTPLHDGAINILYKFSQAHSSGGTIHIYTPSPISHTDGGSYSASNTIILENVAPGATLASSAISGREAARIIGTQNVSTNDVIMPIQVKAGVPFYMVARAYNSSDANKMVFQYVKVLGSVIQS